MTGKIFSTWDETHSELWSHQPIRLEHEMHKSPAFSMDDLARLIENYPREQYSLVKTGARGSSRVWREGEIGNLCGRQVIEAISRRRALAQYARCRLGRQPLPQAGRPDVRGDRSQGSGLRGAEPPGRHSGLLAGRAGLLPFRSAGAGPDPDRRPQAGLRLSEHRAVHQAGAPRGYRAVRRRGRSALRSPGTTPMPRCSTSSPARC